MRSWRRHDAPFTAVTMRDERKADSIARSLAQTTMQGEQFNGQRPAHQLESSSDEDMAGGAAPIATEYKFDLVGCRDDSLIRKRCVFLLGEMGERLVPGIFNLDISREVHVTVNGVQVGEIKTTPRTTLIFLTPTVPLAAQNGLCAFLFHLLQATTVTIISDYSFPAYLPPTPLASDAPPAILFLASYTSPSLTLLKEHLTPHSPPNLVHSLPAALLSVASLPTLIRPSAPPALLVLLPSSLTPAPLNPSLQTPYISIANRTLSTSYDHGGPVALASPEALFNAVRKGLAEIGKELRWFWWDANRKDGVVGYQWVERERAQSRKERDAKTGGMYV